MKECFDKLLRYMPEACLLVSSDGEIAAANEAAARMLGMDAGALPGRRLADFVFDDKDKLSRWLRDCAGSGSPLPGSLLWRAAGGGKAACGLSGRLIRTEAHGGFRMIFLQCGLTKAEEGGFAALNKTLEELRKSYRKLDEQSEYLKAEIASRKQYEGSLRESEARLKEAQRIAGFGNWRWDIETNKLWWSDETYRIFGLDAEDFGGVFESFINAVHPDDRKRVESSISEAVEKGVSPWRIDYKIVRKDGALRYLHEEAKTIFDEKGFAAARVGTVQDITERKLAAMIAERAAAQYRGILGAAMDGFLMVDSEGRITEANDAYCSLIGFDRPEVLKMNLADVEAAMEPHEILLRIDDIARNGRDRFETRHKRKDGSLVDLEVSVNFLPDNGGMFVSFARDITDRKRAEEKMRTLNEELEKKVAERTAELEKKNRDLEKLNKVFVGRELRMVELKKRIAQLEGKPSEEVES